MSTTYLSLSDPMYDQIESLVRQTYSRSCIVWIEEIENLTLLEQFEKYKASLSSPNVKQLFHGTSAETARIIINEGFDPAFNKTSAYGKGVYFSTRAKYSKDYSRERKDGLAFMLVCDVITGNVGQGRSGQPIPSRFNSVTDNLRRPDMYIVDKREACIPQYLVAFYPKAR